MEFVKGNSGLLVLTIVRGEIYCVSITKGIIVFTLAAAQ